MANILLTDVCNLKCPYCFAQNIVNKDANELSPENFYKIIEYIFKKNTMQFNRIGLLGGEPTLCSHFEEYCKFLSNDDRVDRIIVMTNGTMLDKYDCLVGDKISILVNVNKSEIIGNTLFNKTVNNIDKLCNLYGSNYQNHITLGFNDWDYNGNNSYIVELCKQYHMTDIRFSILVPDYNQKQNAIKYFTERKEAIMIFFAYCLSQGIYPHVDCNWMMPCIFTDKDKMVLQHFAQDKYKFETCFTQKYNGVGCGCPIDIYPDLTASRCFGTSKIIKNIFDYDNFMELRQSFIDDLDNKYRVIPFDDSCICCEHFVNKTCNGGCIGFKITRGIG